MAKQEFLKNFRIARSFFFHPHVETDSSQLSPQALELRIARAAIWLTPKSVKGFDADDFPELGVDRRAELNAAIQDFLDVASQVPPDEPAAPEQLGKARVAFEKLLGILEPYLATPQDEYKVEEALKGIELPPWVVNWNCELGSDEDGEAAVWVNFFVDESIAPPRKDKELGRFASQVTMKIRTALSAVGSNRWPYVRVRTVVEHKAA